MGNKALIESTIDLEFVSITKQNKDEISNLKSQIQTLKSQMNDSIDDNLQYSFTQVTNEFESFISSSSINETDLDYTNRTDLVDDFKNRLVEIENRLDSLPETA